MSRRVLWATRLTQDTMRVADLPEYADVRRPTSFDRVPNSVWYLDQVDRAVERARREYIAQFEGMGGLTRAA